MIYLASPYSHLDPLIMKTRFLLAEQVTGIYLSQRRHVYSPIVHCHEIAKKFSLPTDFAFWQEYNRDMIRRCDKFHILATAGWLDSKGIRGEFDFALLCGLHPELVDDVGAFQLELNTWPA